MNDYNNEGDVIYINLFVLDSIVFDNTYSFLRNKKVHYSVRVLPPTGDLQKTASIA